MYASSSSIALRVLDADVMSQYAKKPASPEKSLLISENLSQSSNVKKTELKDRTTHPGLFPMGLCLPGIRRYGHRQVRSEWQLRSSVPAIVCLELMKSSIFDQGGGSTSLHLEDLFGKHIPISPETCYLKNMHTFEFVPIP